MRKFRTVKGLKKKNGPISLSEILKLVKHFKETRRLEDRLRSGRPSLRYGRITVAQSVMEEMEAESSAESRNVVKLGRFREFLNHQFNISFTGY